MTAKYHRGYSKEEARQAHNLAQKNYKREKRIQDLSDKEIVVWDGEGMKLSGPDAPQHYVLFGCSARPWSPLVIKEPHGRLVFEEIADYALDVALEHPNAIHLGYYFKYDQNMIIWSIPWPAKQVLYSSGSCMVRRGKTKYYIRAVFGKSIRITRINERGDKVSILIEDFAPFFASSFVKAYESLFPKPTDPDNWEIVKQGKADRSEFSYADMAKVMRYWRAEIIALHELAFEFRSLMFEAGFYLGQWHGPGALANYIRRENDLLRHEYGGKEENLPGDVHEAIKGAYYGGHFEQYRVGYIKGPVYGYDINSAYPAAFCEIPSLREGGMWWNTGSVDSADWSYRLRTSFGVFRVRWHGGSNSGSPLGNLAIQPLPHRDSRGNISYPTHTEGWYWAPEVGVAMQWAKRGNGTCEILDGWVWTPADENEWPWENVFRNLYDKRRELKKAGNPTQMAYKLGMNSGYGKYAQRAGWDKEEEKAPRSHTLCIAGYITSQCRAKVMRFMNACEPGSVISVETDGVFTTTPPDKLHSPETFPMSKELGEWGLDVYGDMLLLQNGVYFKQDGETGEWLPAKTRGIAPRAFQNAAGQTDIRPTLQHLARCNIGERWPVMEFDGGESFVGLGTAISRATRRIVSGKWSTNPFKASALHCTWFKDGKSIDLEGRTSKRSHYPQNCRACRRGEKPDTAWHDMVIHSAADVQFGEFKSTPYALPWEKGYEAPQWVIMAESDGIHAESALSPI